MPSRRNVARGAVLLGMVAAIAFALHAERPRTVTRAEADPSEPAPVHGVIDHWYSMNGDGRIVVDFDATTVRVIIDTMEQKTDHTQPLTEQDVREIRDLADATWREVSSSHPQRMDSFEQLIILDGDDAFTLSETTIGGDDNRPAASALARALFAFSR